MKPILNQSARKEMAKAVTDCTLNFGKRIAEDFVSIIEHNLVLLAENPQMGQRRPELDTPRRQMRSLLVHEHFQLIYYYHESKATVYIVSLWDTRKNPVSLRRRIRH